MKHPILKGLGAAAVVLGGWIAWDLSSSNPHSIRDFDPAQVGRLETEMWRSYYDGRSVALFQQLTTLLREQYHLAFWQARVAAYHAAKAAIVFQRGTKRAEHELALPDLTEYYRLIRKNSTDSFSAEAAAKLDLEWWIIHRERATYGREALDRGLAALQAELYQQPAEFFAAHARARAEAMLIRDEKAEQGGVTEQDWARIDQLLRDSWDSLHAAVAPAAQSELQH